jgi:hypothetical protein
MYSNFWHIEDPRESNFQGKSYELTVEMTCALMSVIDIDGRVKTSEGIGDITDITFDYSKKTVTIKGEI